MNKSNLLKKLKEYSGNYLTFEDIEWLGTGKYYIPLEKTEEALMNTSIEYHWDHPAIDPEFRIVFIDGTVITWGYNPDGLEGWIIHEIDEDFFREKPSEAKTSDWDLLY